MFGLLLKEYKDLVFEQLPDIERGHVLLEPCRRNTAACICYASWRIKSINAHANIIVAPSDHIIADLEKFHYAIEESLLFAAETDAIVTLGIHPTHPETGYGYIQADFELFVFKKLEHFQGGFFHGETKS